MRGLPLTSRASPPTKRMLPFTRIVVLITALVSVALLLHKRANRSGSVYLDTSPKGLPLNEAAPLLSHDAVPIKLAKPNDNNACHVGRHNALLTNKQRYTLPATHPVPAIGSLDVYADTNTCTTYADRYASYSDAALGSTYLRAYPSPTYDSATFEEHKWRSTHALMTANDDTEASSYVDWGETVARCHADHPAARRALVLRSYENYTWGHDDVRNVRALIAELAINAPPQQRYDVRILVDVHSRNVSFSMSDEQRQRILQTSVPREFWSIATLWSEEQLAWLYPALPGRFLNGMPAVSSYRSCFMAVQVFARENADRYDYVWNWEMDTRSTQDYAQMLKELEGYARGASLDPMLQRQSEWRIPASHESAAERADTQEADLITLNPIFNTTNSGWYWEYDFQNLPANTKRRASMGRNVRFSRRLLQAMNAANVDAKQSTHCESWPATVLVQEQQQRQAHSTLPRWKGVYVPHPAYTRHQWPAERLAALVNRHDIYRKVNEKALRDLSFYYDGAHARDVYDAWRVGSPRVCRAPALLHPIKRQP